MFVVKTMDKMTFGITDEKASECMKMKSSGSSFTLNIERKGKVVGCIESHQICSILEMDEYKRQYSDKLKEKRQELCPYCANAKIIGQQCGACGGNPSVEDRFKNQHFNNLVSQTLTLK